QTDAASDVVLIPATIPVTDLFIQGTKKRTALQDPLAEGAAVVAAGPQYLSVSRFAISGSDDAAAVLEPQSVIDLADGSISQPIRIRVLRSAFDVRRLFVRVALEGVGQALVEQ